MTCELARRRSDAAEAEAWMTRTATRAGRDSMVSDSHRLGRVDQAPVRRWSVADRVAYP